MIPQTQKIPGPPNGDCLRACIASILEMPIEDLPNYHGFNWWNRWVAWGKRHGLIFECYDIADRPQEAEWWIAGPQSPRIPGVRHAVVMHHDELAWDPHPRARAGKIDVSTTEDAICIWSADAS